MIKKEGRVNLRDWGWEINLDNLKSQFYKELDEDLAKLLEEIFKITFEYFNEKDCKKINIYFAFGEDTENVKFDYVIYEIDLEKMIREEIWHIEDGNQDETYLANIRKALLELVSIIDEKLESNGGE